MNEALIGLRDRYLDQVFRLLDGESLIIMSGVRRVGKSFIAVQLEQELSRRFSNGAHVIRIGFEKIAHEISTADELIAQIKGQYAFDKKNYILFDEILGIDDWERAINFLYRLDNCKVILISSNRRVLSPELKAVREENCEVIQVLPLSLNEFIQFQRFIETSKPSVPLIEKQYTRFNDKTYTIHEIYKHYVTYGGLPILKPEYMGNDYAWVVSEGSYGAIITRDVLEIESGDGFAAVTDPILLRSVISALIKSLGENISATRIGKQTSRHLGRPNATKTIQSYIQALLNAHMFYIAERYDVRSGKILKTLPKYYVVDTCFHNYLSDTHVEDESRLLENAVFFELLRRGCKVYNGKLGHEVITFVAIKGEEKFYIQVANDISEDCAEQLFSPLRRIRDDSTKMIIALGTTSSITYDGIVVMNGLEFLMENEFNW